MYHGLAVLVQIENLDRRREKDLPRLDNQGATVTYVSYSLAAGDELR